MFKQTLRFMMVTLLAVTMLAGTGGVAQAYLTPSNPAVLVPNPDALHMPASYTGDYTATPNPAYVIGPGSVPDYLTNPNWAYSPPLTKFVDPLPGLCIPQPPDGSNCDTDGSMASKNIPIAIPDIVTYPGSDYYELELVQFAEPMHTNLLANPTTLRGYRQVGVGTYVADVNGCTDPSINPADPNNCTHADDIDFSNSQAHYLGPIIVAVKDRPVRVKFINKLPSGPAGDLFVPVDVTIMGAGDYDTVYTIDPITNLPVAGSGPGSFSQNRGELHLHGGRTPWISDGTPHQWITPADEANPYKKGISVVDVPDMPPTNPGEQTYYWTNQQSARLMFYHDHAWGITRVNVYVGEAAGYIIRDQTEQDLITAGVLPADEIPLVIQDKTFVDAATIKDTDPTWAWGTQPWNGTPGAPMTPVTGDLWWPHVYMPAQNPFDITGIAPMGRWAFGPYFWPATQNEFQPVPNPYYDPACDPAGDPALTPGLLAGFCQPPEIPSTPNPSWGAEAFMDTPVVNGTAYPIMNVEPKPYRLRVLNAAHDRFFNLSLFVAADKNDDTTELGDPTLVSLCDGTVPVGDCTEVKMLPAVAHPGFPASWPADGRPGGVPDFTTRGPDWIMIGTEGGFLPQPVVIPAQPVNWNADVTTFNAGNVNAGSLILGPAERADVIVDFSLFGGKTLILYNDAPAPWPALDPHYDYYTGAPDNTEMGGYGPIAAGVGPNTRTIMQIVVNSGTGPGFSTTNLQNAFDPAITANGVFNKGQDPIIVAQGNMNPAGDPAHYEAFPFDDSYEAGVYMQDFSAYNRVYDPATAFPTTFPYWGIARINDTKISFRDVSGSPVIDVPLQPKAIQDEQGETFDMFGRMRAGLGLQLIQPAAGQVGFVVQTYSDPSTEILEENGIQVWKITHNGVDTHPVHFHLFDVQVLNRVGWDGFIRLPDPTELGWKDTVRISPLEDTIVALKPVTPRLPFGIPESVRPLNPATALGSFTEMTPIDPATGDVRNPGDPGSTGNEIVSLDWEYVWHCHILSHEENDMMRPISFKFIEALPDAPTGLNAVVGTGQIDLTWTDPSPVNYADPAAFTANPKSEIGFIVERRALPAGEFAEVGRALANQTSFADTTAVAGNYEYRVAAFNAAGSTASLAVSPGGTVIAELLSPVNGSVLAGASQTFTWTDVGATAYELWVGDAPGKANFYSSTTITATSATATTLPTNGITLYARLFTMVDGVWLFNDYTYTAATGALATMISPTAGSVLAGASQTFTWTDVGATAYELWVGDAPGKANFYSSTTITATSATATTLPTNGITLYARLFTMVEGVWLYNDYTYTAATGALATMISPTAGTVLAGASQTFTWTDVGATAYELWVGDAPGKANFYSSTTTTATSATATTLPTNGITLYARLFTMVEGVWLFNDYTYTAATGALATMISPTAGSVLAGASQTFTWTDVGATAYELWVGDAPGKANFYSSTTITATSATATTLPTNGITLYARLFTMVDGVWLNNDYTYTAATVGP